MDKLPWQKNYSLALTQFRIDVPGQEFMTEMQLERLYPTRSTQKDA